MARTAVVHQRPPWHVLGLPPARSAVQVAGWRYLVWARVEQQDCTTTPVSVLREQLYGPSGLHRQPRIGDTFAVIADTAARHWPSRTRNLRPLLRGRVFDVSAEARLAARLAYQGSLAAVLPSPAASSGEAVRPAGAAPRLRAPELTVAAPRRTPGRKP